MGDNYVRATLPRNWHLDSGFVDRVYEDIANYVAAGYNDREVARRVGVTDRTVWRWRHRGGRRPDDSCRNCGEPVRRGAPELPWYHPGTGLRRCDLEAEPR